MGVPRISLVTRCTVAVCTLYLAVCTSVEFEAPSAMRIYCARWRARHGSKGENRHFKITGVFSHHLRFHGRAWKYLRISITVAAGARISGDKPDVESSARPTRLSGRSDRPLSRSLIGADAGGLNLSSGNHSTATVAGAE